MPAGWQEEHDRRAQLPPPAGQWGVDGHHRGQHHGPADGGVALPPRDEMGHTPREQGGAHTDQWPPPADDLAPDPTWGGGTEWAPPPQLGAGPPAPPPALDSLSPSVAALRQRMPQDMADVRAPCSLARATLPLLTGPGGPP
jgi:hypothetical protein